MKVFVYCQHVLGIGHLFRSLEICKALSAHEVVLITGGPRLAIDLPQHVRVFRLPELRMDTGFKGLLSPDQKLSVPQIKDQRRQSLLAFFQKEKPDVFLVELYPFGRKAFRFELDPILEAIAAEKLTTGKVICSVRDILVEKEDQQKHEGRAVKTLNRYFDAVLIHSDPELIKLEETFYRYEDIKIPIVYTGFIAQRCPAGARRKIRNHLGLDDRQKLIIASAGGGSVGKALLESVVRAFPRLADDGSSMLQVYTGPYIAENDFEALKPLAGDRVSIGKFSNDFISYLAAADLSISMAGYNTSMNILATRVRALVLPFSQNQEQTLRASRLAAIGALSMIEETELTPDRLARIIDGSLSQQSAASFDVNIDGAAYTARWIESCLRGRPPL